MIQVRKAVERGHFDHGWLDTYHTFSFGDYYDPTCMGFRSLRVINDDRVQPGQGFGTHGHRDMEIVTYVLDGALQHKDSMGNGSIIRAGELQRMTAGTGVRHSEFNPSDKNWVHCYQIWLVPERRGLEPSYEQLAVGEEAKRGRFRLVASHDGADDSLTIHQDDCSVRSSVVRSGIRRVTMPQAIRGPLTVLGRLLLCTIFLLAAVGNKIPHFSEVSKIMESVGVPAPQFMLAGAIVFLLVGSVSVIIGYKARIGAVLLLTFLVLASYYFHPFWKLEGQAQQEQMIHFMKNLSMIGAMFLIVANGSGPMSVDSLLHKRFTASADQRGRFAQANVASADHLHTEAEVRR